MGVLRTFPGAVFSWFRDVLCADRRTVDCQDEAKRAGGQLRTSLLFFSPTKSGSIKHPSPGGC